MATFHKVGTLMDERTKNLKSSSSHQNIERKKKSKERDEVSGWPNLGSFVDYLVILVKAYSLIFMWQKKLYFMQKNPILLWNLEMEEWKVKIRGSGKFDWEKVWIGLCIKWRAVTFKF